jgi:hypothetical protein
MSALLLPHITLLLPRSALLLLLLLLLISVSPVTPVRHARKTMKRVREVGFLLDYPYGPVSVLMQLRGISTDTA